MLYSNTIYNFVQRVRQEHSLPKVEKSHRDFIKLPDTEFGKYAQVDFGEKWMYKDNKRSLKVYFMVMILCRSRYKYVHIQLTPFTTKSVIYAHEKAFEYFQGMPLWITF